MKKHHSLWWMILLLGLLSAGVTACSGSGQNRYEAEFLDLFDTVTQVVGYAGSKEEFTEQVNELHDKLEEYHQLYDIYHEYEGLNNIKTINNQAGAAPVKVDQKLMDLLAFSKDMYEKTDGKMNIAFGSVLSIWHEYREAGINDPEHAQLPPMELLEEASRHTDIGNLILDTEHSTAYLADPDMRLDVGAVAKGYSVEQVCRYMEEKGMNSALVSVGGNVRAIGRKQGGLPWKVAIQNPDPSDGQKYLMNLSLEDLSLVSSGDYQRYYTVDGRQYHHIIDPATLMPAAYYAAVSIVCQDSGLADSLSTAIYNLPLEQGRAFIESLPGVEALWVYSDGSQVQTSGFADLIEKEEGKK